MVIAKTSAQKMQKLRDKMRAAGFKLVQVWVHPGDESRVKAFVERLTAKRKRS
jgi:Protein  of unknown function (DUF3018)